MMLSYERLNIQEVSQEQRETMPTGDYVMGVYDGETLIAYGALNLQGDHAIIQSKTLQEELYKHRNVMRPMYRLLEAECKQQQIRHIEYQGQ
ncbi:hypothetical protein [Marinicrinis sediminis]|uniref:Uncharacterized protein n=1 Tax=Marinicrinis sediminis TaxID=1652465 RepID=A0ABW5R8H6_9BACL